MKILTTNSAGNDVFGGIHTRATEQVRYSPQHTFQVIEFNHEKGYESQGNLGISRVDTRARTGGRDIFEVLHGSETVGDFHDGIETLVNECQDAIGNFSPDVILIPGTSLTSYFLYKASRREGVLGKVLHEYAGVLEKELGSYSGAPRYILGEVGKEFVSPLALQNATHLFPSNHCKDEVEKIHGVEFSDPRVVWNGLSKEFSEELTRSPPSELTLGYVGRLHHVKNIPFFMDLPENLGEDLRLEIITDLSTAPGKPIGRRLLRMLTDGEIFYNHPRGRLALGEFYAGKLSASVVSSFFETYCHGAVESIASGTPALLSERAGAREVFEKYDLGDLIFSV